MNRSSPQARSRREGIHDWVRGEAPRELSQIRTKAEPNRYAINQRWCRIRQLKWTVRIRNPRSGKIQSEGSDRERRETWIWEYDSVSMGFCSFRLITVSARSLWNERKHFRHYNSMRVLIVLPGVGSWLGHRGCWLHWMNWSVWQVLYLFMAVTSHGPGLNSIRPWRDLPHPR